MSRTSRPWPVRVVVLLAAGASALACVTWMAAHNLRVLNELEEQRAVMMRLSERVHAEKASCERQGLTRDPQLDVTTLADEIAQRVGEVLAKTSSAAPSDPQPEADVEAEAEASTENLAAFHAASDALTQILSSGRWTEEDKHAVRKRLAAMTTEQHAALLKRVVVAANSGRLAIETVGPPL